MHGTLTTRFHLALVTIGFIDTHMIGCTASEVILGIVAIRFVVVVMFKWFFSWKSETFHEREYFYVHILRDFLQRIGWTTKNSIWHALFLV